MAINKEAEITISHDEFLKLFNPKKSNCACYGRGFINVISSVDGPDRPIKGDKTVRGINFCQCVMKRYHKFTITEGGEILDVCMNEEISGHTPPQSKTFYFCNKLHTEINARDCMACYLDGYENRKYLTRALCVKENATKIDKQKEPKPILTGDKIL